MKRQLTEPLIEPEVHDIKNVPLKKPSSALTAIYCNASFSDSYGVFFCKCINKPIFSSLMFSNIKHTSMTIHICLLPILMLSLLYPNMHSRGKNYCWLKPGINSF